MDNILWQPEGLGVVETNWGKNNKSDLKRCPLQLSFYTKNEVYILKQVYILNNPLYKT